MLQPAALAREEYQPWSRGRGVDVWAMLCAARDGDLDTARALSAANPQLIECEYEYRRPLYFAVLAGRQAMAEFLLDRGADPTAGFGEVPLAEAARERGHLALAGWFDDWMRRRFGACPEGEELARWVRERDAARVRQAIDQDARLVRAADSRGNTPLHWAVMTRQLPLIGYLLDQGAPIDWRRPDGARPLDVANGDYHYRGWRDVSPEALRPPSVVIGYLLARGADYDLAVAAKLGDCDRARALLDVNPGLVNTCPPYSTYYSGMPLRCAAQAGQRAMVRLLLERGADPNAPEPVAPHGGALRDAIGNRDVEMIRLLLEHGANPNAAVESSGNCLWAARDHEEIYRMVESRGGKIPLEMSCYDGDVERVKALLDADPALLPGEEALHYAMSEGHQHLLEFLYAKRPDAFRGVRLGDVTTPEMARWLLARGVDAQAANWMGIAPLHRFARSGRIPLVEVCLEHGAPIDAIDDEYQSTPLGWAARAGQTETALFLLERGAALAPAGQPGWAHPAAWARRRGHAELAELLTARP